MSTSGKYISEALMKDKPKIPIGLFLRDRSVTTRKIDDSAVTTDKIKDSNVTKVKLSKDAISYIDSKDNTRDIDNLEDRLITIENKNLYARIRVITDKENYAIREPINLGIDLLHKSNNNLIISDIKLVYNISGEDGQLVDDITLTKENNNIVIDPQAHYESAMINVSGSLSIGYVYSTKTSIILLSKVSKTINYVGESYIGYVKYDNKVSLSNNIEDLIHNKDALTILKHAIQGSYNIVNTLTEAANLIIVIPKEENVLEINKIVQHGALDVEVPFIKQESEEYICYISNNKHNPGSYTFILS